MEHSIDHFDQVEMNSVTQEADEVVDESQESIPTLDDCANEVDEELFSGKSPWKCIPPVTKFASTYDLDDFEESCSSQKSGLLPDVHVTHQDLSSVDPIKTKRSKKTKRAMKHDETVIINPNTKLNNKSGTHLLYKAYAPEYLPVSNAPRDRKDLHFSVDFESLSSMTLPKQIEQLKKYLTEYQRKLEEFHKSNDLQRNEIMKLEGEIRMLAAENKSLKSINRSQEKQLVDLEKNRSYDCFDGSEDHGNKELLERLRKLSDRMTLNSIREQVTLQENERLKKELAKLRNTEHKGNVQEKDPKVSQSLNGLMPKILNCRGIIDLSDKCSNLENTIKSLQRSLRVQRQGFIAEINAFKQYSEQSQRECKRLQRDIENLKAQVCQAISMVSYTLQ